MHGFAGGIVSLHLDEVGFVQTSSGTMASPTGKFHFIWMKWDVQTSLERFYAWLRRQDSLLHLDEVGLCKLCWEDYFRWWN